MLKGSKAEFIEFPLLYVSLSDGFRDLNLLSNKDIFGNILVG